MRLACFASDPAYSRGRRIKQEPAPTRSEFQRDRDRIVHSTSFRRLVYKTQVFLNHEGDLFRTRLTHSLEVAQLGRSIARSLHLNEDLVEAIALAHDLGHTPFGHAGQDALNDCMAQHGGFEHNLQSLRVVDFLEERYPEFNGLNLTFETREGILKHCSRQNAQWIESQEHAYSDGRGGIGLRFIEKTQPSVEAQLCNLADEIAYNAHDVDDGIRSGLITLEQMQGVPLFAHCSDEARRAHPQLTEPLFARRWMYEAIRLMLSHQVYDVVSSTQKAIEQENPGDVDEVRQSLTLVQFSTAMQQQSNALKSFLFQHLYRHAHVTQTMELAKQVVKNLFAAYLSDPREMHSGFVTRSDAMLSGPGVYRDTSPERIVADYIAGMTDRFAAREHARLTGQRLLA
jgi:dGTPase